MDSGNNNPESRGGPGDVRQPHLSGQQQQQPVSSFSGVMMQGQQVQYPNVSNYSTSTPFHQPPVQQQAPESWPVRTNLTQAHPLPQLQLPVMPQSHNGHPGQPQNPLMAIPVNPNGHARREAAAMASIVPPLPTSHVKLPAPINLGPTTVDVIFYQFFHRYPEMWDKFNIDYQGNCKEIFKTYLLWGKMVKEQRKRFREAETVRDRLQRKIREQYREAEKTVRRDWPTIHEPRTDDEKKFLPSSRAAHLVQKCCGPDTKLTAQAETALELLAKSFVEDAVSFGVAMARRRPKSDQQGAQEIQPSDVSLFLRTSWNIMLPTNDGIVKGYTCNVPKTTYKSIAAATRKENFMEGKPLFNAIQATEPAQKKEGR